MRPNSPAVTRDQFHGPPSQLKRRLGLPGATRESPLFPHHNLRETPHFTPQLEKNHEISPSSQDEALLLMQGLETNPDFLSKLQRRFDSLSATQWPPRDTCRNSRGERSSLLPLQMEPDSPGEPKIQPRDSCCHWRGTQFLDTRLDEVYLPCSDSRTIPSSPS